MKHGMLFISSRQFNKDNFKFVNFPDFCGDATTAVLYLNISILNSPLTVNICLENYLKRNIFCQVLFLEISYYYLFLLVLFCFCLQKSLLQGLLRLYHEG